MRKRTTMRLAVLFWMTWALISSQEAKASVGPPMTALLDSGEYQDKEDLLQQITDVMRQPPTLNCIEDNLMTIPINLRADQIGPQVRETVDFAARLLANVSHKAHKGLINPLLCEIFYQHKVIFMAKIILGNNTVIGWDRSRNMDDGICPIDKENQRSPYKLRRFSPLRYTELNPGDRPPLGNFTLPYFHCQHRKWLVSYVVTLNSRSSLSYLIVDLDISDFNINQCNSTDEDVDPHTVDYFADTDKCHQESSYCQFTPGAGWRRGGYECVCRDKYYSKTGRPFNGSYVEVTWHNWQTRNTDSYEYLYKCLKCQPGCANCTNGNPCQAEYNWTLRITLLTISLMCVAFTFIIMIFVYHMRSLKVFKMASPTFLQICLIGCITMYLEMAAIFPVLNMFYCVCTKWTRHLGFCLTFSGLLMKTWRVSLTYRVKSAHKIKLTDKQLLQWMTPIILIMVIYLGSWTISDAPVGVHVKSKDNLTYKQCTYNWWDHSIAIGEMLFLLWGSKVCFGVRKAESFFNEAKCIALAVYSITIVNVVMASFHVFFFSNSGPDVKYFFGFLRTQLSTTTTIGLVFGPKFYRVLTGRGNQLDTHSKSKAITITLPVNGTGSISEGPLDPREENEDLKEEIQKLAAQMEFMKIVQMEMNNRHLKPKLGGYFSEKNSALTLTQSPQAAKNYLLKSEITEPSSPSGEFGAENV